MNKLFPTQEIGSLAKPSWRVKGFRGEQLSKKEIKEAIKWGRLLKIENLDALIKLLDENDSLIRRRAILEWSAIFALRFFEAAGLDIVFDGEQWRSEMYEHVIKNVAGFKFMGFVRSFDYRYFNKAACIAKPHHVKSFYLDEFNFIKEKTEREIKIPFTGPYTLVDWSFNEYYEKRFSNEIVSLKRRKFEAKREFLFDLIKEVIRPEISKLVSSGAKWIQIDEPAATTNPTDEEMDLFVEAFNETVKGFNCTFSLHNCYSNYQILARHICKLRNCSQIALEFANRDSQQLGIEDARKCYRDIKFFEEFGFRGNYGLGVIDVLSDFIEPPELVRDRILYASKLVGDPTRIFVSTDCGLRTRTWNVSFKKLENMVLGAELARKALK